ncbi:MAG TPA: Ig-like domain-containing protein [Kofleriaceae bacterium]|jgi:hypothetical protein
MLARSIAVGALVLAGCYDPPHPVCGFACASHATVCPDGYACNSVDNRCHLSGFMEVHCESVPDDPGNDLLAPVLVAFQPTSNFEPVNTAISVQFDKKVLHVTSTSFFLTDDVTGQVVTSAPSNPSNPFTWSLSLNSSLSFGGQYTVHLTSDITDENGDHFAGTQYQFAVIADPPPSIDFSAFIEPLPQETDVAVDTVVTVTMTETVQTLSGKFHLIDQVTSVEVPTTIDNTGATSIATLDPDDQLLPLRGYVARVDGDVRDTNGNPMGPVGSWFFTTGNDFVPPQARETMPKANSVAPVDSSIVILFDEPATSIGTFAVTSSGTPITGTFAPSNGNRTWTFLPDALPANAAIHVALTNIADSSGNTQNFAYSFTTAP